MARTAWAGLVTAAVVLLGCAGGAPTTLEVEASADFVGKAAALTLADETGRFEMTLAMSLPEVGRVELTPSGSYDAGSGLMEFEMDPSDVLGDGMSLADVPPELRGAFEEPIRVVLDSAEGVMYMGWPAFDLIVGNEWVRMDLTEELGGLNPFASTGGVDPTAMLRQLAGADAVEEVGREEIDGVDTTHLEVTVVPSKALDRLPEAERRRLEEALELNGADAALDEPVESHVYVDDDGRVRRVTFSVTIEGETVDATIDYFDFGADVDIEVPEDAVDASEVLGDLLGPAAEEIGG